MDSKEVILKLKSESSGGEKHTKILGEERAFCAEGIGW